VIIGGAASDSITTGGGSDLIVGDHGAVDYNAGAVADGVIDAVTTSVETTDGDDSVNAGNGDNVVLTGGSSIDLADPLNGDVVTTGSGDDVIIGDYGIVTYNGSGGVSYAATSDPGMGGEDRVVAGDGYNIVLLGDSDDTVQAGAGADVILGDHGSVLADGADRDITTSAVGTGGDDTIVAGGGNDILVGGAFADTISGNDGSDLILGDYGTIYRDSGNALEQAVSSNEATGGDDTIEGNAGDDVILGGAFSDTVYGGNADGSAVIGPDADLIFGDSAQIDYTGGVADDAISTASATGAADILEGNEDDDIIFGGAGSDIISGSDGNDIVLGDGGTLGGSSNNDVYTVDSNTGAGDTLYGDAGQDFILGGDGSDTVYGGSDDDTILGDQGRVVRTAGDTVLRTEADDFANGAGDILYGDSGNDVIAGGAGSDTMDGGAGDDILLGSHGVSVEADGSGQANDVYANAPDVSGDTLYGDTGNDILIGDSGYVTRGGSEQVQFVESTDTDQGGNDTVDTGSGDNIVLGGFADDTITAYSGNDILIGDNGEVDYNASGTTREAIRATAIDQGGDDSITAGTGDNFVVGGFGSDVLASGDDDDVIFGDNGEALFVNGLFDLARGTDTTAATGGPDDIASGAGNDIVIAGIGGDTVNTGAGDDIILADIGVVDMSATDSDPTTVDLVYTTEPSLGGDDTVMGDDGDDIIIGGTGEDILHGDAGSDAITGDGGMVTKAGGEYAFVESTFRGIGGPDQIYGGLDNDYMIGGDGGDSFEADLREDTLIGDFGRMTIENDLVTTIVALDWGSYDPIRGSQFGLYDVEEEGEVDQVVSLSDYIVGGLHAASGSGVYQSVSSDAGGAMLSNVNSESHAGDEISVATDNIDVSHEVRPADDGSSHDDETRNHDDQVQLDKDKSQPGNNEQSPIDAPDEPQPSEPEKQVESDGQDDPSGIGQAISGFSGWMLSRRRGIKGDRLDREALAGMGGRKRRVRRWQNGTLDRNDRKSEPVSSVAGRLKYFRRR